MGHMLMYKFHWLTSQVIELGNDKWQQIPWLCAQETCILYILQGWEGSMDDARIQRDAVSHPFGIKAPKGNPCACHLG